MGGPGKQAQLDVAEPRTAMASHVEPEPLEPLVEPPVEPLRAPPQSSRSRRARVVRSGLWGTCWYFDAGSTAVVHLVPAKRVTRAWNSSDILIKSPLIFWGWTIYHLFWCYCVMYRYFFHGWARIMVGLWWWLVLWWWWWWWWFFFFFFFCCFNLLEGANIFMAWCFFVCYLSILGLGHRIWERIDLPRQKHTRDDTMWLGSWVLLAQMPLSLIWNMKLYSEPKPWCSFHHQGCGGEFAAGFPDLVLHIGPAASLLPAALGELRTAEAVWGTAIQSGARPPTLGSQRWKVNDVATWRIFSLP